MSGLLRCIIGNPFRPFRWQVDTSLPHQPRLLDPAWLTLTVLSLAIAAYDERPGRKCERCKGLKKAYVVDQEELDAMRRRGSYPITPPRKREKCSHCHGTGQIEDGALDPVRLLVLRDALLDAGCDSDQLLTHLASEGPHVRGCWVVDLVTGRE